MVGDSLLVGDRVWFYDTRTPARRMAVSPHPGEGVFVVSLWQGESCTATFRLPMAAGATLISTLAHGMAEGLPGATPGAPGALARGPWWRRWAMSRRRPAVESGAEESRTFRIVR